MASKSRQWRLRFSNYRLVNLHFISCYQCHSQIFGNDFTVNNFHFVIFVFVIVELWYFLRSVIFKYSSLAGDDALPPVPLLSHDDGQHSLRPAAVHPHQNCHRLGRIHGGQIVGKK